jgi:hypothetical protein
MRYVGERGNCQERVMTTAPPAVPTDYATLTVAQQNAFWLNEFKAYRGTVTPAWVKSNADLKPYAGMTAVQMYQALASKYPKATPQQRGSTVYQVWLGAGLAQAVGGVAVAAGTATGAVNTGVLTGLPSWQTAIGAFIGDLTSASLWIRAAKIIGGGAILLVGVAKLSGAGGIAAKAVKAAPLL